MNAADGQLAPGRVRSLVLLGAWWLAACSPSPVPLPPQPELTRAAGRTEVTLLFGGDTSFARAIEAQIGRQGGRPETMLTGVCDLLAAPDLTLLNLESPLAPPGLSPADPKEWLLRGPPAGAAALAGCGVDVALLANNHILDYGSAGLLATLEALAHHGIGWVGLDVAPGVEPEPRLITLGEVRLGLLAFNAIEPDDHPGVYPRTTPLVPDHVVAAIARLRPQVDHVVVSLHRGEEYVLVPTPEEVALARRFIDAGATLVIGHHPHTPQPVEEYGGGLIAYSLGNFLFDLQAAYKIERTYRSFVLLTRLDRQSLRGYELIPIRADRQHRPRVDPTLDVASWVERPVTTPYRLSLRLREAQVVRQTGERLTPCADWKAKGPKRGQAYLRWLHPRWGCPDDGKRPWLTVAATAERADAELRRGIWAHPHPGGLLRLRFPGVAEGERLVGHAGFPDRSLELALARSVAPLPPVRLTVRLAEAGRPPRELGTAILPVRPGWTPLTFPLPELQNRPAERALEVELTGGPPGETGFVFDLWVE